ncbi:hypothetical protein ABQW55_022040 [Xanthomonas citri pv. malvacearum]|uniref:hypothetical protein n=1 Tax=Xanthomonas citri TaxID=346 RepID=UPI00030F457A|nr:hypothetical protein [Xanthomonas citri]WAW89298.1 hypothetical protein LPY96_22960 [Xanthomonas citri pv. malvacearum]WAW93379.1 hypothetical protein LPY95_21500 [Xanthomonas citri pv. malvacearum]WAW97588.1 hypothetical protein LGM68_21955 [Xanthomonas citri pv. malvacearum]
MAAMLFSWRACGSPCACTERHCHWLVDPAGATPLAWPLAGTLAVTTSRNTAQNDVAKRRIGVPLVAESGQSTHLATHSQSRKRTEPRRT